jgi:hypothetical protein
VTKYYIHVGDKEVLFCLLTHEHTHTHTHTHMKQIIQMMKVCDEHFQDRLGYSDLKYISKLQCAALPDIPC